MYTTKEAAKALMVQPMTVRRYAKLAENPLKAEHKGRRKDLIIREDDLVQFARIHGMAIELPQE